jgi:hypothetical protein
MSESRTTTRKRATTTRKTVAPPPKPTPPARTIDPPEIVSRVTLGDSREVRITRITTGGSDDYIRVGINLLPNGQNMSGAVFPASYLDDVIAALRKAG